MNRRTFLKTAGMGSLSLAAGCLSEPEKTLFSLVQAPDDMVTGKALWYATTCRECPAGCGVLAKNREGRVVKLEGNPFNPIKKGSLCPRGQAALQGIFTGSAMPYFKRELESQKIWEVGDYVANYFINQSDANEEPRGIDASWEP
jgi:hypothetical protein